VKVALKIPCSILVFVVFIGDLSFCSLKQLICLQCFDTVGWVAGRASGL